LDCVTHVGHRDSSPRRFVCIIFLSEADRLVRVCVGERMLCGTVRSPLPGRAYGNGDVAGRGATKECLGLRAWEPRFA
jgi:hypothetical protein